MIVIIIILYYYYSLYDNDSIYILHCTCSSFHFLLMLVQHPQSVGHGTGCQCQWHIYQTTPQSEVATLLSLPDQPLRLGGFSYHRALSLLAHSLPPCKPELQCLQLHPSLQYAWVTRPPFLQSRACSRLKEAPQPSDWASILKDGRCMVAKS